MLTKKIIKLNTVFLLYFFLTMAASFSLYAQNPEWINYTYGEEVVSLCDDGNYLWAATRGGLVHYNKSTGEKEFFNRSNSSIEDNQFYSVFKAKNGDLWMDTFGSSLTRFDGTTWTNYNSSNSPFQGGIVWSITEDTLQNLWFGTSSGLVKFDGTTWTNYLKSNSGLPDNSIKCISASPDGTIWVGTNTGGLAKFKDNIWTVFNTSNSSIPANTIYSLATDSSGRVWVGTFSGLASFDGSNWTVYTTSNSGITANQVRVIAIDTDQSVWMAYSGSTLSRFDGTNWTTYTSSNSTSINSFSIDEDGIKWFGINGAGILRFDGTNWTQIPTSNSGLLKNTIQALEIDESGNKWIGTSSDIMKFDNLNWTWFKTNNVSATGNPINAIQQDSNGNLWVGSNPFGAQTSATAGGVIRFTESLWSTFTSYNSDLSHNYINAIQEAPDGTIWFSGKAHSVNSVPVEGGLSFFDGTTWVNYTTASTGAPISDLNGIAIDSSGKIWCATTGGGIVRFDGSDWVIFNSSNSGLPANTIYSIAFDNSGNLWAGLGYGFGIVKFDGTNWETFTTANAGLPSNEVVSIFFDTDGIGWFGTKGGGLLKYNGITWESLNTSNSGISSDYISCLTMDSFGNLWAGTNSGLTVYREGGVDLNGSSLPVELSNFTFSLPGDQVLLTWKTQTESNNFGFEIQKSVLKLSSPTEDWETIGFVAGKGTTSQANSYSFLAPRSGESSLYRLKQVDLNGSVHFSPILTVKVSSSTFYLHPNYPNPFNPETTISFDLPAQGMVTVSIFDVLGRKVAEPENRIFPAGYHSLSWKGTDLAGKTVSSGVYFCRVSFLVNGKSNTITQILNLLR